MSEVHLDRAPVPRRRVLTLMATTASLPFTMPSSRAETHAQLKRFTWRGAVLGADANMTFYDGSTARAQEAVQICLDEVRRLEEIFSLYNGASQIVALNRHGRLQGAAQDLRRLLALSKYLHRLTNGAFDPSIQPLWRFYAQSYARMDGKGSRGDIDSRGNRGSRSELPPAALREVLALSDFERVQILGNEIVLGTGQALTLNGIAQGYITDAVAALLRAKGWRHVLLNLGEYRALGPRPDRRPFQVALRDTDIVAPLDEQALASSAGAGFIFPGAGTSAAGGADVAADTGVAANADAANVNAAAGMAQSHLLDPRTGRSPKIWRAVHVRHASAAFADGLSTAFYVMELGEIVRCVKGTRNVGVWLQALNGTVRYVRA